MAFKKLPIVKFIVDIISVPVIIILAYSLKFKLGWTLQNVFQLSHGVVYNHAQVEPYLENVFIIILIWVVTLYSSGLYSERRGVMAEVDEFIKIVKSSSYAIVLIIALSFFVDIMPHSRFVIVYGWLLSIAIFTCSRLLIHKLVTGKNGQDSCCVLGHSPTALSLVENIVRNSEFNYAYLGSFSNELPDDIPYAVKDQYKHLGPVSTLKDTLLDQAVSALFIVSDEVSDKDIDSLLLFCEEHNIQIYIYHPISVALSGVASYSDIGGVPLLSYKKIQFSAKESFIKRSFDILFSLCLLLLASPVLLLTSIWIKLVSPGPVFFTQTRVGLLGKPFEIYKFRTMDVNAEKASGPQWADSNKSPYIKGGKFLRKFSIDELPQLLNILKNDMSLIGPRPERPFFVEQICQEAPYFSLRHQIKGGLTGWAQIHGRSYLTDKPIEKFKYDLYYIKNWSIVLDIKILIKSFFVVLKGEEAY